MVIDNLFSSQAGDTYVCVQCLVGTCPGQFHVVLTLERDETAYICTFEMVMGDVFYLN